MDFRSCSCFLLFNSTCFPVAEFGKQLLSLARNEHPGLLKVYEASFEGSIPTEEEFDAEFFMENARGIIDEDNASNKS